MSDITIAGFIEKAENIFFLFRSLLTPGHLQSSISWDKEYAILTAIAVFLIAAVSYAGSRLIKTIRKRQRNFKELVNALEDDGKELDYNLKPLFPEERTGIDPKSTPTIKEKVAPEGVHEEHDFDNYVEEITSVLGQEVPDTASYHNSHPNGNTALAVAPVSLPHKEKKIFSLAMDHLIIDKIQKPGEKKGQVINLGLSDLKRPDLKEEKSAVAKQERKIITLALADVVEESADIKHTGLPDSGENSQTEDESAMDEETLPDSIMAEVGAAISEFDNMEAEEEAYSQTPDQTEESVHEEESDASDSIWAEVEAAISEFDNMEAAANTGEEAYSESSDQVEDTHLVESDASDSIWDEAEAAISKFDIIAGEAEEKAHAKLSDQSDEESFAEEADSVNSIPDAEESIAETDADTSSIQEEDIVKWEDPDDSISMLAEIEESVLESNEIQMALEVSEETPSTVNVEEVEEETPLDTEPTQENVDEPEQPEQETVQPMDIEISPSEESIDIDVEESFEVDPDLAEIEAALDETELAASEVDEPVMMEVEDPAFDPVDLEIDFKENADVSPSEEEFDFGVEEILEPAAVDPSAEAPHAIEENIPEPVTESLDEPPVKDKLSPERAKRIISRLEFFQRNVDEVFKTFMLNFLRKKRASSGKIPGQEFTDTQSEIKRQKTETPL